VAGSRQMPFDPVVAMHEPARKHSSDLGDAAVESNTWDVEMQRFERPGRTKVCNNLHRHSCGSDLICRPSRVMSHPSPRFRSSVSYTDSLPHALEAAVEATAATISGNAMG
jgi:hypothetical protein